MLLELKELNTYYDESHVLQGVSLNVDLGEIVCLLGRNGVGKSTTLKSVIGLVEPRSGEVVFKREKHFFSTLDENLPIILVRKNERRQFHRANAQFGYTYEALGYKRKEKLMEPFILYMDKKTAKNVTFSHPGEEILFMLEGTWEFTHGDQKLILRKGDCIYFDASIPHSGKPIGNKPIKAFMVICSGENDRSPLGELVLDYRKK